MREGGVEGKWKRCIGGGKAHQEEWGTGVQKHARTHTCHVRHPQVGVREEKRGGGAVNVQP